MTIAIFLLVFIVVTLVAAIFQREPEPEAPRKPVVSHYTGPLYNAHGREVVRTIPARRAV